MQALGLQQIGKLFSGGEKCQTDGEKLWESRKSEQRLGRGLLVWVKAGDALHAENDPNYVNDLFSH